MEVRSTRSDNYPMYKLERKEIKLSNQPFTYRLDKKGTSRAIACVLSYSQHSNPLGSNKLNSFGDARRLQSQKIVGQSLIFGIVGFETRRVAVDSCSN